jgi:PAS domain-containing protein
MGDEHKTKEQLINELAELRQRISGLEALEAKQKQAEEVLRESEEKYSALVEQARDVISITQDGVFEFCNKAAEEITGYTHEELIGMPFLDLMAPESSDMSEQRYQARMAGKGASSSRTHCCRRRQDSGDG